MLADDLSGPMSEDPANEPWCDWMFLVIFVGSLSFRAQNPQIRLNHVESLYVLIVKL